MSPVSDGWFDRTIGLLLINGCETLHAPGGWKLAEARAGRAAARQAQLQEQVLYVPKSRKSRRLKRMPPHAEMSGRLMRPVSRPKRRWTHCCRTPIQREAGGSPRRSGRYL